MTSAGDEDDEEEGDGQGGFKSRRLKRKLMESGDALEDEFEAGSDDEEDEDEEDDEDGSSGDEDDEDELVRPLDPLAS